ncbi:MAG: DUF3108 domain-containing protein [Bryobacteraceae bacterium]
MQTYRMILVVLTVLAVAPALVAQTASDLLQKGIYTQETVGDIDGAIKIYRQVLSAAKENREYAAQAQYRLGLCLLSKGDTVGAGEAFRTLIADYPEQKELVAQAQTRLPGDLKLLPAPWAEGETHKLALKMPGGAQVGWIVYAVGADPADPARRFLVQTRTYVSVNNTLNSSRVAVDRQTMFPAVSDWTIPPLGEFHAEYGKGQAVIRAKGQSDSYTLHLDRPAFDNEEWMFVLRRLPLAPGYRVTLPIATSAGRAILNFEFETLGIEGVEVPAGKFQCYKVQITPLKQTFWISVDGPRYLVKFDGNSVVAELISVTHPNAGSQVSFKDETLGFSVSAPGEWLIERSGSSPGPDGRVAVSFLDPQVAGHAFLRVDKKPVSETLKDAADDYVKTRSGVLKDYQIRPASWSNRQIGGRVALSYVADCGDVTGASRKMAEYVIVVDGAALRAIFIAYLEAGGLEAFQKRFDPIAETLQLK